MKLCRIIRRGEHNQSERFPVHHLFARIERGVVDDRIGLPSPAIVWAETTVHVPLYSLIGANAALAATNSNRSPIIAMLLRRR